MFDDSQQSAGSGTSEDEYAPAFEEEAFNAPKHSHDASPPKEFQMKLRPRFPYENLAQTSSYKRGAHFEDDSDEPLYTLGSDDDEVDKSKKKKRKLMFESDDEDDIQIIYEKPNMRRKQLSTIQAEKEEKARFKRIAEKQCEFNGIEFEDEDIVDMDKSLNDSLNISNSRIVKSLVLDNSPLGEVSVHSSLAKLLKPHQAQGVQFMYNCTIESLERLDQDGGGGILAHCMGLGKTLQSITFLHTILTHPIISGTIKHAMVVCPKNVIINWKNEFDKWLIQNDATMKTIRLFEIDSKKDNKARLRILKEWHTCTKPSVLIIGYESYRNLTQDYTKPNKKGKIPAQQKSKRDLVSMQPEFRRYLQNPGPNVVIADEGHKLKNIDAEVSKCMAQLKTKRRICLTGTPLQNNLLEYYCMVNFVKEGLLGTTKEFKMRFENPIKRGQTVEATAFDVSTMRRRCFVLFKKLEGIIDRRDFSVLKESLRPKLEYVITLRLTDKQFALYDSFLQKCASKEMKKNLLSNYFIFSRIFTHPFQIIKHHEEKQKKAENNLDDFIVNDSDVEDENNTNDVEFGEEEQATDWFSIAKNMLTEDDRYDYTQSYKLLMMIELLKQCEAVGDKVLIFSQSLETLRLIESVLKFLEKDWFSDGHEAVGKKPTDRWRWSKGADYFLITGDVSSIERDQIQRKFNLQNSPRARLCLISTKAGSLGTNFVGANRVIIFDQNWNPSHDRQALFRAYRFGQTKPTYIYRFVAYGTIENNIYSRQVTKESVSARVIDENQIKRHYTNADLDAFYVLKVDNYSPSKPPRYTVPEDKLLANVFVSLKEGVVDCVQHDTLLAHQADEELNEDERTLAWQEYESRNPVRRPPSPKTQQNDGFLLDTQLNETTDGFVDMNEIMRTQRAFTPVNEKTDLINVLSLLKKH